MHIIKHEKVNLQGFYEIKYGKKMII